MTGNLRAAQERVLPAESLPTLSPVASKAPLDPETEAYFDTCVPEYGVERLAETAQFIAQHGGPDASLIDVGAGTGNTLAYLKESAGITDLAAIDVSSECLKVLGERVESKVHHGSILDRKFMESIDQKFDFAVIAAVLHHLIGKSRGQSREYAEMAVVNSKLLLKPGGHLIIHEPVFSPPIAMSAVFYLKKFITRFTSGRVGIGGYWNNIGAPVVSYYNSDQVRRLASAGPPSTVVDEHEQPETLARLLRPFMKRASLTLVVRLA
jgi:SAM-dependent methyltransferase